MRACWGRRAGDERFTANISSDLVLAISDPYDVQMTRFLVLIDLFFQELHADVLISKKFGRLGYL